MNTLEALTQTASHEAVLAFLLKRWENNRRFFQHHRPDLAPLFNDTTRRYELSFDATGLNIRHKSSGTMVYPVHQGRSQLIDTARALAHAPLKSPHYQTIATQGPLKPQDETAHFITAKGINQIIRTAQTLGYTPGTLFADRGQTLPPLVFYGLLSGLHLQLLFEAGVHPGGALIIEPEPEFFLLSAYFVDYGALKEWDLHLAIGAPPTPAQAAGFFHFLFRFFRDFLFVFRVAIFGFVVV